ncbi:hypothetical protein [Agromyces sp. M3QZ16-3]|uniref:hypothetical protein n=1 Tax=Agromyces sp. M3QZ16-3 TaxID=3447585 RepID=UPI003F68DECA
MTNTIVTVDDVAKVAAELVGTDLGLARHFSRDIESSWGGGTGDTIRVRVPSALPSRERSASDSSTALTVDSLSEQSIPVTLSTLAYSNVALSVADLELNLQDMASQVIAPQTRAISRKIEQEAATALLATPASVLTYDAANPAKLVTAMRKQLRDNGVSGETSIIAVAGSQVYADLLDADAIVDGRVRGVEIHEMTRIPADEIVAFVRDAFALVVRAPQAPAGAPASASVRSEGGEFALTAIRAFDAATASDRSIVEALVAVQPMPLAIDNEDGTVTLQANAGAVRVVTV